MELLDLGQLKEIRFQVIPVTVPNLSPAGAYENSVQLDREYNRIVGIGYFEVTDGGEGDTYNVGCRTQRQTYIDPININAWNANEGVPLHGKYYKMNIPYGSGDTFYATIRTITALSSELSGQMVLILTKDLVQEPK